MLQSPKNSCRTQRVARTLLITMALLQMPSHALAEPCRCAPLEVRAAVKQANTIFIGRALTLTTDSSGNEPADRVVYQTRFAFDVQTVIKGAPQRFVEVVSLVQPCPAPFTIGTTYLVFGRTDGLALRTDSCSGNVGGEEAIAAREATVRKILSTR